MHDYGCMVSCIENTHISIHAEVHGTGLDENAILYKEIHICLGTYMNWIIKDSCSGKYIHTSFINQISRWEGDTKRGWQPHRHWEKKSMVDKLWRTARIF